MKMPAVLLKYYAQPASFSASTNLNKNFKFYLWDVCNLLNSPFSDSMLKNCVAYKVKYILKVCMYVNVWV